MFLCTVHFHKKPNQAFHDRQNPTLSAISSDKHPLSCCVSITNHQSTFYSSRESRVPLQEIKTDDYLATLNTTLSSLTLRHKKANNSFVTIHATTAVIEKLQQPFWSHSDGKVAWNLLMDTPYSCPKDSLLTHIDKNANYQGIFALILVIAMFAKVCDVISSHLTHGLLPMHPNGQSEAVVVPSSCDMLHRDSKTDDSYREASIRGFDSEPSDGCTGDAERSPGSHSGNIVLPRLQTLLWIVRVPCIIYGYRYVESNELRTLHVRTP